MENKLGFGCMRLPVIGGDDKKIDLPAFCEMADAYLESGGRYFDTAYMYHGGESERAVKKALVERHPRESFLLADKLPVWMTAKTRESCASVFAEQLERTGAGYFDRYLLHGLDEEKAKVAEDIGAFELAAEWKKQGLIRSLGFSFHDSAAVLDGIFTRHPELEFVQLQLNYMDWESEDVQSRLCYETAVKHGKRVIVMEPVKGGALAAMPDRIRALLLAAAPDASVASWALRFAAGLPAVDVVLSGMSDISQLRDNIQTFADLKPLSEEELALVKKVVDELNKLPVIPCTGCKYCVEACPEGIGTPGFIKLLNDYRKFGNMAANRRRYNMSTEKRPKASACVGCRQCEEACPQHLPVASLLKEIAGVFEG